MHSKQKKKKERKKKRLWKDKDLLSELEICMSYAEASQMKQNTKRD